MANDANGTATGSPNVTSHLAEDIPLYRVKVDKYGRYLHGTILRRSTRDSIFHEKMKAPNFSGWSISDSAAIKLSLYKDLPPRPDRAGVLIGIKLQDSSYEVSNPQHIPLNHSASTSVVIPPQGPSYKAHRYYYTTTQSATDRNEGKFRLVTEAFNYQVAGGNLISQGSGHGEEEFRSSDGLPAFRSQLDKRVGGSNVDKSYLKRTLTLISIDSASKQSKH